MDPGACRESLATFLDQEISALDELAGLLGREHGFLAANDVDSLETAMAERQTCVGNILRVEDERRSLCRMLGYSADLPGLEKLIAWCDPTGSLQARWADCAAAGARCRDLNDRNGALVNARLKNVETILGSLTGQRPERTTYSAAGAYTASQSGRVVTTQA